MSGPWEEFQPASESSGPWEQFSKGQAAPKVAAPAPMFTFMGSKKPYTHEEQAIMADMKARSFGTGIPKVAYEAGGKIADAGHPFLGYLADVGIQAIPALLSSFNLGGEVKPLLETPAKKLMQSAVKPAIDDLASGASDRAVNTMLKEGINPTRGGMIKAGKIAGDLNKQVEGAIGQSNATVSVNDVTSRLSDLYRKSLTQVNPNSDTGAVEAAVEQFRNSPLVAQQSALQQQFGPVAKSAGDVDIPVQLAHALKKGTYASLGSKSYGEVASTSVEAQKQLARGLREEVANAVPSIVEPLKREAALMNVKDVAGNRALMEANKNPMGLAALRMDNPLSAATFMADRWAALKAMLARMAYTGSMPENFTPAGVAVGQSIPALQDRRGALYR